MGRWITARLIPIRRQDLKGSQQVSTVLGSPPKKATKTLRYLWWYTLSRPV